MEDNNLDTLKILFIIKGVIALLTTLFVGFMFLGVGTFVAHEIQQEAQQEGLPFNPAVIISSLGIFALLLSLIMTVMTFLAAKYIGERRNHTFVVIVSIFTCISGLLGLLLGIFALIELHKTHVKPLFGRGTSGHSDVLN